MNFTQRNCKFETVMFKMFAICAIILCCVCKNAIFQQINEESIVVVTSTGAVRGTERRTVDLQKPYYKFLGIPYAEAPTGNLRFEPPVAKRIWPGILDGTQYRSKCVQSTYQFQSSEDCLFVNVFTPQSPNTTESAKLPVMVWIHGGGFTAGSGNLTNFGPDYFLDQDIVFVSIQYRLGIFGFLSTGDLVVPGNNGLKDQILALKWINANIVKFGGDADKITVMGQSAGAASISYLLQSKLTKGLYQQAIMESGVSLCLWALSRKGREMAETMATDLGLHFNDSRTLVEGLKTIDYSTLQSRYRTTSLFKYVTSNPLDGLLFAPVIEVEHDGAVISNKSHQLLKTGQFQKIPIILGHNNLEGVFDVKNPGQLLIFRYELNLSDLVPIDMNVKSFINSTVIGAEIKMKYFGLLPLSLSNRNIMDFISDGLFVRPVQEFVRLWSKHRPAYYYVFSHEGGLMGNGNRTTSGTGHNEELGYLFHTKYDGSEVDYVVRKKMVKLWSNFVKTGNPTPTKEEFLNVVWPQAIDNDDATIKYLEIGDELTVKENPRKEQMSFWTKLYRRNGRPPYDTY